MLDDGSPRSDRISVTFASEETAVVPSRASPPALCPAFPLSAATGLASQLEVLPAIQADERRLFNAFYNLINNAIPEVPAGGSVTVRGQCDTQGKTLHLLVADTGRGMPPEFRDSLFTPNFVSRKPGGTGLGTKIVKDVIDAHGGTIRVESEQGRGTMFHIALPITRPQRRVPFGGTAHLCRLESETGGGVDSWVFSAPPLRKRVLKRSAGLDRSPVCRRTGAKQLFLAMILSLRKWCLTPRNSA